MISLQSAKRLKSLGFPQKEGNYYVGKDLWDETMQSDHETRRTSSRDTWVYAPILEEIIDEIPNFHHLSRWLVKEGIMWDAFDKSGNGARAKTKMEAVIKLYIKLNG